ncbi:MAG: NifB/NifX family molybdenum-iron cluster-binding protein [Candidatus Aenigmarchaeota archaeon]|nr:NifB/NifX family molybdenum-iron cluster-binding protein [Candidatus Aenigmarchaeota archaeon]
MRIAIASSGKDENSKISAVFGRAPYYLIYENKKLVEVIKNPFAIGGGGAGFSVAQMLINKGVEIVISGNFGSHIENVLRSKKIKMKQINDKTVKQSIEEIV